MPTVEARLQRLLLFLFPSKYKGSIFPLKSKVLSKCIKSRKGLCRSTADQELTQSHTPAAAASALHQTPVAGSTAGCPFCVGSWLVNS